MKLRPTYQVKVEAKSVQKNPSCGMDLEKLKRLVENVCECDQQSLLDHLLLLKMNRKTTTQQERLLHMFMDSLAEHLGKMLGQSTRVFPLPLVGQAKKVYKDVEVLLKDFGMQDYNNKEKKIIFGVIARILVQYAGKVSVQAKIPVSMKLVLQTTIPLHALLDDCFPNYIQSGVMGFLLKQSLSGYNESEDDEDE